MDCSQITKMREQLYKRPDLIYKIEPIKSIRLTPLVFEKVFIYSKKPTSQSIIIIILWISKKDIHKKPTCSIWAKTLQLNLHLIKVAVTLNVYGDCLDLILRKLC